MQISKLLPKVHMPNFSVYNITDFGFSPIKIDDTRDNFVSDKVNLSHDVAVIQWITSS